MSPQDLFDHLIAQRENATYSKRMQRYSGRNRNDALLCFERVAVAIPILL